MKRLAFIAVVLAVAGSSLATPLIARGPTNAKFLQGLGYVILGYSQTSQTYDWVAGEWKSTLSELKLTSISGDVMLGLGVLPRLELDLLAPLVMKDQGTNNAVGLGDASVMLRYAVLSGLMPVKATLSAVVTLPTSPKDAVLSLGDRTLDFGLGLSAQTIKLGPLVGHARLGYWLQGKKDDEAKTKVGNLFEYVIFPDIALGKKASVFVTLSGAMKAQDAIGSVKTKNTDLSQHSVGGGFTWNPVGPLWLKPKFAVPMAAMSKGGSLPAFTLGMDVWAFVP